MSTRKSSWKEGTLYRSRLLNRGKVDQVLTRDNDLEAFIGKVYRAARSGYAIHNQELVIRAGNAMDISD
jgi:hypothetical protein